MHCYAEKSGSEATLGRDQLLDHRYVIGGIFQSQTDAADILGSQEHMTFSLPIILSLLRSAMLCISNRCQS